MPAHIDQTALCALGAAIACYCLLCRRRARMPPLAVAHPPAATAPPPPPAAAASPSAEAPPPPPPLSREVALRDASSCALLIIDMQNFCCHPAGGCWAGRHRPAYYDSVLPRTLANIRSMLDAARTAGVECVFTVIESLTRDGRERSLDYKISHFHVPRGDWGAQVVDELAPRGDEMVLPKGSSSVFISTSLAYLLRNLGVEQLVIAGGLTDQCVDSAVRDACDLGFLVTLATDGCVTHSAERHETALANNRGYARQRTSAELVAELRALGARPAARETSVVRGAPARVPVATSSSRAYVRFEIIDYNGKALSKVVPSRHRDAPVYLYSGAIGLGANSEVTSFPDEIAAAGLPNARLVPFWQTHARLPWACGPHAEVSRVHYCRDVGPTATVSPRPGVLRR